MGLPPVLRREIADAQYLVDLRDRCSQKALSRFMFSLWGATCDFGQSVMKWAVVSSALAVLFALLFCTQEFNNSAERVVVSSAQNGDGATQKTAGAKASAPTARTVAGEVTKPRFSVALYLSIVTFTTLGFGDVTPVGDLGRFLVALEVIIGYLMLGGLVSIVANRLARLS